MMRSGMRSVRQRQEMNPGELDGILDGIFRIPGMSIAGRLCDPLNSQSKAQQEEYHLQIPFSS